MDWKEFLEEVCRSNKYRLTETQIEVVICLDMCPTQATKNLREEYIKTYGQISNQAFAARLQKIFRAFKIRNEPPKLPYLRNKLLKEFKKIDQYKFELSSVGIVAIHSNFPTNNFSAALKAIQSVEDPTLKKVDILQTFAPNLNDYVQSLKQCLQNNINIRILLAWPYSKAAELREMVLRKYRTSRVNNSFNILHSVTSNLETLEGILQTSNNSQLLQIKLYDTLPSLSLYRAGDYLSAAPFLHGSLAVNTFQLEFNLQPVKPLITQTLLNDFELMWEIARPIDLSSNNEHWRNSLRSLF